MKILDTTLRDGSYVNNFQIDAKTTEVVVKSLDEIGFDYIEVGHGLGMNATTFDSMKGKCSDIEWINAAKKNICKSKWGMFFIPGIGRFEDIALAADVGMDFIRIGANIDEYSRAIPYIKEAKRRGLFVCANFMKTYGFNYKQAALVAKMAESEGCDLNCIVDSAGCMLPEDVKGYVSEFKSTSNAQVGFHAHNNLGMAISNCLMAIDLNVDVIDTSVRGMGRSAGNAVAEILLLVLDRLSIPHQYDIYKILDLAESIIDPIMKGYQQVDSMSVLSGYAKFHSSFTPQLIEVAKSNNVDPRKLLVELCKENCLHVNKELLMSAVQRIRDNEK